ncbi:hypothetical protein PIIN_01399 [Serendipita indica DSM 11827]|uniref:LYR motif-containing protein Cup1-like N-terminal domain-containing protein n=1 Tax=Serendipita indica (strain DSM 11827) TaxID=1109443 RepID=G4T8E6_SERID|nr:hypothetical protein PIIN_01399 [Serendipita indica DSM 11827]
MALRVYRDLLRQAGYLPHPYLQAFVKGKARDYFRRHRNSPKPAKQIENAKKELRRLQKVNNGSQFAFMRLLRQAFGRIGRMKWELLKPHFATVPERDPIIPKVESSRPPTYTPTLLALVSSSISKSTDRVIPTKDILNPLPARADPASDEARLLGPLSLRRQKNMHRRFFLEQTRRVYPPLEVLRSPSSTEASTPIPQTGLETLSPIAMLHSLSLPAAPISRPSRSDDTDRPLEEPEYAVISAARKMRVHGRSKRWLRRRYRELLGQIPKIVVEDSTTTGEQERKSTKQKKREDRTPEAKETTITDSSRKVSVQWSSKLALNLSYTPPLRTITHKELAWIQKATELTASNPAASRRKK